MRLGFTALNSFIVSTFALLSLITPVTNAVDLGWVGRIVLPNKDHPLPFGSIEDVVWRLDPNKISDLSGVSCIIMLMQREFLYDGEKASGTVLRTDVSILANITQVTLPILPPNPTSSTPDGSGPYYMSLVSTDEKTIYANSDYLQIHPPPA